MNLHDLRTQKTSEVPGFIDCERHQQGVLNPVSIAVSRDLKEPKLAIVRRVQTVADEGEADSHELMVTK